MNLFRLKKIVVLFLLGLLVGCDFSGEKSVSGNSEQLKPKAESERIASLLVNPRESNIEFFLKDDKGAIFGSLDNLKTYLEKRGKTLRFAMNGGMYREGQIPLGLFIENKREITPLKTRAGEGNFYLQPNGVFAITNEKRAFIVKTQDFKNDGQIEFATQSGPMLLIENEINPLFQEDSKNLNIRNGVCVLDDEKVLFAISRTEINFYEFAKFFKSQSCRNALYLDGFVSRMYLPEKSLYDLDGEFGVIIAVSQ